MCIQSCLPLCHPRDCSLSSSSVQEIFPGKHTGVGCHFLHQGIFPTQGSFQTRDQNFISCVSCSDRWVFVLFCFITEPPRKPRTTIWSSNSTPGHLSREKHNSNRHMWNLKKAMVCCAVVSWVEKATWCRKAEGEGSPCCFQHRGPRVCWLTAPVLLCLHMSASWKSQWSQ